MDVYNSMAPVMNGFIIKKLSAELANGRLATMAIAGMFFQNGSTSRAWGDWTNYTASPLRALASALGVQTPVGFFDLGLTAAGSVENFKRRRWTELRHGRISLLATMGYHPPEITGELPGYLSQSAGLKFADVPNALAAISKVPQRAGDRSWRTWPLNVFDDHLSILPLQF